MNIVKLEGNVIADPTTNEKETYCRVRIVCENNGKTAFLSFVAFGDIAKGIITNVRKGHKLNVIGHLSNGSYNKDGQTVYTLDIVADAVKLLTDKNGFSKMTSSEEEENPFK